MTEQQTATRTDERTAHAVAVFNSPRYLREHGLRKGEVPTFNVYVDAARYLDMEKLADWRGTPLAQIVLDGIDRELRAHLIDRTPQPPEKLTWRERLARWLLHGRKRK